MCLLENLPATQAVAYKSERKRKVSIKTDCKRWQKRWNNFAIRYIKIETKRSRKNASAAKVENDSAKAA